MGPRSRGGFVPRFDKQKQQQQNTDKGTSEGDKKSEDIKKEFAGKSSPGGPHNQNQASHHQQRRGGAGGGGYHHHGNQQKGPNTFQKGQHDNHQDDKKQSKADSESKMETEEPQAPKKFTGRCRLFVGNLPNDTNEDEFKSMFSPYGELSEVFVNPTRGFGFVKLVGIDSPLTV